jgi:DNA-binding transcriptional MerR regulator
MAKIQKILDGLPDKQYYRIGEVAEITKVKPYVLRFWETEFKAMAPPKSRSKQRMYRKKEIETILQIKELLYERGFTIKGARRRLAALARGDQPRQSAADQLRTIRTELLSIAEELAAPTS